MDTSEPLGFDRVAAEGDPTDFTVEFSLAPEEDGTGGGDIKRAGSEEIGLLERTDDGEKGATSPEQITKLKEETVFFDDGVTSIDFILTYQDEVVKKKGQADTEAKRDKRAQKRNKFLENCREAGLVFEHQNCNDSPDQKTHYLKVHGTYDALLKGAENMLLRMPIRENNLRVSTWRERFFDQIKLRDPFEPVVPRHLIRKSYFTAPFNYERRKNFIDWDDEKNFFSSGQRGAIVYNILLNTRYGPEDDHVGLLRLLANGTFNAAYPLHESDAKPEEGMSASNMTDRQFLYQNWSFWKNWYKRQPLDQIRRYFGEKIGIYFTWLGFYTSWLLPAAIVGFVVFIFGLSTITNSIADDICNNDFRYDFYMCPRCDRRCDFWYLRDSCLFSRLTLIFDNGATVFFAVFMAFWAVFFLEFWKRRQYFLQYDWDVLGFEDSEQRARPEFEQRIKRYIRRCKTPEETKKFIIHNPVLDKQEYIQPQLWFYPKLIGTFAILISMVAVVVAIVFLVILYRLAVAGGIYSLVSGSSVGPAIGDIIVSITGAIIQLVAIIVMNKLYELLAYKLTNWELHRTQTEYDDSFITKMYLFQFVNFYSSLIYIAFFKGNLSGNPGGYNRIFGLRVDECATYGCLLELTIQLFIIMVGKQVLNNTQELAIPYVKRLINCIKHEDTAETDVYSRWEKDYDLIPLSIHGLFFEYLELVIQYGFITIFVAALPLAPLFALLNNWVEIRLDAHKFIVVFRRPVSQRAGDIGAWYGILSVVSQLAVVSNAFLIAFTAQFIPIQVYVHSDRPENFDGLSGYVDWSLSSFNVSSLLDGRAFPAFDAQELLLFNGSNPVPDASDNDENFLYLPFVNFTCLKMKFPNLSISEQPNIIGLNRAYETVRKDVYRDIEGNETIRDTILLADSTSQSPTKSGECFLDTTCRFRGFEEDGGVDDEGKRVTVLGERYWHVQTARLAFVVVFEHFVFVITAFIAYIIPDVPQSVKNEIQREKLLAYEAVHARKERSIEDEAKDKGRGTEIQA